MKIRQGFVSNSSSSSFICDVCNDTFELSSDCVTEYEVARCQHGHEFCDRHIVWTDNANAMIEYILDNDILDEPDKEEITEMVTNHDMQNLRSYLYENDYYDMIEVPECMCPVCTLTNMTEEKIFPYILMITGKTKTEIMKDIKDQYGNYLQYSGSLGIK